MDIRVYYKTLNLRYGASKDEIKNSYRQLAKKYHPDINPTEGAKSKFIELNKAYEFLSNLPDDYFSREAERKRANENLKNKRNYHDEEFHRRARERAKAKHEQMKRQQEEFKKSGFYDILLLLQYALHYFIVIVVLFLMFFPIYSGIKKEASIIHLVFFLITGGILGYYIIVNRQKFFKIGKFYYTLPQVKKLIFKHPYTEKNYCYYCKNHLADALPYKVHLLRVKDVILNNKGPLQHNVGYKRKNVSVVIPRSRKALIIHFASTFIRLFSIISAMIFLKIDSVVWKFIFGLIFGTLLSFLVQHILGTKARNSYIFTYGFVTKIIIWLIVISFFTSFDLINFNIYGSEKIGVMLVILFLSDPLIEGIIKQVLRKKFYKSLFRQPPKVEELIANKYQYYLEISGWSMLYPIGKWIFG